MPIHLDTRVLLQTGCLQILIGWFSFREREVKVCIDLAYPVFRLSQYGAIGFPELRFNATSSNKEFTLKQT